jgi:hypothetical protein
MEQRRMILRATGFEDVIWIRVTCIHAFILQTYVTKVTELGVPLTLWQLNHLSDHELKILERELLSEN